MNTQNMVPHPVHSSPPLQACGGCGIPLGLPSTGCPLAAPCTPACFGMLGLDVRLCQGPRCLRMCLPWPLLVGALSTFFLRWCTLLLAADVHASVQWLLGSSGLALVPQGSASLKAQRPRAACPSGNKAQSVRLSRHRVPCRSGLCQEPALRLATVELPDESTGSLPEPEGPARCLLWRALLLPFRLRFLPGAPGRSNLVSHRLQQAHPRKSAQRSCPRKERLRGCLQGARGGSSSHPLRACLDHWPDHAARSVPACHEGRCGLGKVGRTGQALVKETAPMLLGGLGRMPLQASRRARWALELSQCPLIALI
jgi:hypothetical protein